MSIQSQKILMKNALSTLDKIDRAKSFFQAVDPTFTKTATSELEEEYAEIMYQLYVELQDVQQTGNEISSPILNCYATNFQS